MLYVMAGSLFLLIVRPYEVYEILGDMRIEFIYGLFTLLCFIVSKKKRIFNSPIVNWLLLFLVVMCISSVTALQPEHAFDATFKYFKICLVFFIMMWALYEYGDYRRIIEFFVLITILYVLWSLWEFMQGRYRWSMGLTRLMGRDVTYGHPNTFASTIATLFPFVVALLRAGLTKKIYKWILLGFIPVGIACVLLTGSRGGFVQLLFLCILFAFARKGKIRTLIILLVGLFIGWYMLPENLQNRFYSLVDPSVAPNAESAHSSAEGRIDGLLHGIDLFMDNPLLGVGPDNTIYTFGDAMGYEAHNLYGQVLGELGFLGTLTFFMAIALCSIQAVRNCKNAKRYLAAWGQSPYAEEYRKQFDFVYKVNVASGQCLLLLLFAGNFGHNLFKYNWLFIAYVVVCGRIILKSVTKEIAQSNG
ncbi:O-antigen ligase family protein [uncultured Pseudodesulfovibrio sp.]|uniref:O-antigen ligase family protein n=1 Tax=uncultured Pseudodesulfovibrio sp. TaxID=2035858 RepID=UPI0029C7373C|nr:O-antigen ligase family protein [uncultured Pseudodesulfovibrio sp.]